MLDNLKVKAVLVEGKLVIIIISEGKKERLSIDVPSLSPMELALNSANPNFYKAVQYLNDESIIVEKVPTRFINHQGRALPIFKICS